MVQPSMFQLGNEENKMKSILIIFLLVSTSLSLHAQQNRIFAELINDSIEVSTVIWTTDSVEFAGDVQCAHQWTNGEGFWSKVRDLAFLASRDSAILRAIPPQRVLPRICSKCFRKEFLFEHVTKHRIESEYGKLQRRMITEKQKRR